MKSKKGLNNFFRIAFLTLVYPFGWISSICLLVAVTAKYFNPSETDFIALFGLFFPIIFVVTLILFALLLLLRSKQAYIQLIVLLIAAPTLVRYIAVRSNQDEGKIKIFTFNVHGFRGFEETASKIGTHNQIVGFVNTIQADIVCIQEFRSWSGNIENDVKTFAEETGFKASHFVGYWKRGGIQSDGFLILSKFDIEN
ncbi:MAG: hypothetical protein Q8T08_21235, partial [Ignavibacteria bacterium]|nr:hypothetical protein [Ignavibacteria bacterium]